MTAASPTDDPVSDPVRLRAHAKLTLSLRVLGRRDDGYHELEALVASISSPSDIVEVALRGQPDFTLQVAGQADGVPGDSSNLAVQAARLLLNRIEPGAGVRLRLRKGIPAGAGLGGGSADAAAVLHAVAQLLPEETAGVDLAGLAAELGSDVPFCFSGGLAWMRGRGEVLEPVATAQRWRVVVAVPPMALSTPDVYAAWDAFGGPSASPVEAPPGLAALVPELRNDLEPAALSVEPRLAEFRDRFAAVAGRPASLAGSGSAYFVVVEDDEEAEGIAQAVAGDAALAAVAAPVAAGVSPSDG